MSITKTHELHKRRFGRNVGVGLLLTAFIFIVFGMTMVKITGGDVSGALQGKGKIENGD
ncbi:hypothetical protein KO516_17800 [Citreicella sp. C3M06]|uniref:hypothetical protein n=1 Tax=Roseobacteraceae TaxID=2854170 RepID=UPI001C08CD92|nr:MULTISPECIES: hypothetical protein [Roseobacteraceae]MBU2962646.1 hypothetical protein [Citreicella sp. C3M06]MDO6586635.1 hypothetical protein [Salipiger sp. 1_MG-2023]